MISPFRYPGGKSRRCIQKLILSYAPNSYREYREPFLGGGGIGVAIEPSVQRWFNDVNPDLMAAWLAFRDHPDEFITKCRSIPVAQPDEEQVVSRTGNTHSRRFHEVANTLLNDGEADRAFRFFFINRVAHSASAANPKKRKSVCACAEVNWALVFTPVMEQFAARIREAKLTCGDFAPLFQEPGEEVFVYADPPYGCDTDASASSKLYAHGFTWADHERLAGEVHRCPHRVMLSYDDHPRIRELYRDMYIQEAQWTYCGSSSGTKKRGRELIITNYRAVSAMLIDWDEAA